MSRFQSSWRRVRAAALAAGLLQAIIACAGPAAAQGGGGTAETTPAIELKLTATSPAEASLGDTLEVTISGLHQAVAAGKLDPAQLRLFLDGRRLNDAKPEAVDLGRDVVVFRLRRTAADKEAWSQLLSALPLSGDRTFEIGVGAQAAAEIRADAGVAHSLRLRVFSAERFWPALGVLAVIFALLVRLATQSDILRDSYPVTPAPGQRRPFSLARCQMAFWFFLVVAAFLLLFVATGDYNGIITQQTFALLGISVGTGLAAVALDVSKDATGGTTWPTHGTFLTDLLTDTNGMTLHRFQMLVWTLILGAVFVIAVWRTLALPEFDATLLVLMGIASGTYLGFKLPEKQG